MVHPFVFVSRSEIELQKKEGDLLATFKTKHINICRLNYLYFSTNSKTAEVI